MKMGSTGEGELAINPKTVTSIVVHEIYVQNSDNVLTKGTRLFIFM